MKSLATRDTVERVSRAGFDRLLILPALGDDACYVAKIRIPRSAP